MTYPAVRLPTQAQSDHRRPGIFPGRRFAVAAAIACAAASGALTLPAAAGADQAVVSATIFPGAQGSASSSQVMLSTLNTCASYAGPSSITMQSATQTLPAQPVSEPAWTLGTVLTCGLQIPTGDVTAVQVVNFAGAYETPLSNPQIFDTGQYSGSDGALPTIYVDGGENQTTYVRPPLSASDANAVDNVVQQDAPIGLIVYENQPPLVVTATQSPVAGSQSTTEQVTLGATVTTADGTSVPSSGLTFGWTVDNSQPLTGPAPVVTVDAGVTPVTVQVYDPATGTGGTNTFDITYNPPASQTSTTPGPGAGNDNNGSPTGATHGQQNSHGQRKLNQGNGLTQAGTDPGAGRTRAQRHASARSSRSSTTTPATTAAAPTTTPTTSPTLPPTTPPTTQTTTVTTPATTPGPGLTVDRSPTKAPPHPHRHVPKRRSAARPAAPQRVVAGRLVADVQALPEGASTLVHPIAAQAAAPSLVHGASDGTSAPTWVYAGVGVLALLGGGALYERRGRRGRTLHR